MKVILCLKYYKKSNVLLAPNINKLSKRAMHRVGIQFMDIGRNQMSNIVRASVCHRNYPGDFKGRVWEKNFKYPTNLHKRDDLGLTEHQATHINIEHTATETITMIFTSAKSSKDPNVYIEKLSPIKADGSFTPMKDPKTGKLVHDVNGNVIPDPNKGGQYVAVLVTPRKLGKDVKHQAPINAKAQQYLDQHEVNLKRILENARMKRTSSLIKYIGNKDEEQS